MAISINKKNPLGIRERIKRQNGTDPGALRLARRQASVARDKRLENKKGRREMSAKNLKREVRDVALEHGADLVGVVSVKDLAEHEEGITRILPSAKSVVVVVAKHSLAAIGSANNQVAQFDTIHTYGQAEKAAHGTARFLESRGAPAVAVPAFIPLDMAAPKKGMRGEICWRRAGVRAGLGSYGENGLLVTPEFGSAVRVSGVVTAAELPGDPPVEEDVCDHCMRCIEVCPTGALAGRGKDQQETVRRRNLQARIPLLPAVCRGNREREI